MCLVVSCGPLRILDTFHPVFDSDAALGWLAGFLLVYHVIVVALFLLLKLSIHVLHPVPVLLSSRSQGFATVNFHDVTRYLSRTVSKSRMNN